MHTLAPIDNVEFSPELLAFAVRRADSHQQRLRALADRRTCARVARLYRTLSLVHGALVDGRAIRKRALFYADVALFRAQAASDAALLDCAALLQVPPARLGVHASPRGLVRGALLLNGSDCRQLAHLIPAAGESLQIQVDADVQFILIIEKEASFQTLINANFDSLHRCVLVCGRGYPDVGTRTLVRALEDACSAPQLALVDADPFGIEILLTYTVGSKVHAANAASVNARHLRWLGVHVDDADAYRVPPHAILPLTAADVRCGERLLRSDALARCRAAWRQQVLAQLARGTKLEIQALGEQQLPAFILSKIAQSQWL